MQALSALASRSPADSRRAAASLAPLVALAPLAPLLMALGLWVSALPSIDTARMNDLGLISVLPLQVPLSVVLIVASGVWHLRRESPSARFLALHLVALILILYGTATIVEEEPRFAATYIHVGISEYITRTDSVNGALEARFNWPGFFILTGMLSEVIGFKSTLDLAAWAPVYLNLAYLLPLTLIFRSITTDVRLVWAGLFLFELTNWVGQDYFSPQGLNYFLFLSMVGLIVNYFRTPNPASGRLREWLQTRRHGARALTGLYSLATPEQSPTDELSPGRRAALGIVIVIVFSYVAFSHQLTPFFTVAGLLALVAFNRISLRGLPILLGVIAVVWVSYMTVPFLSGHVKQLASEFGQVGGAVGANVTGRVGGSDDHRFVVLLDMVFSVSIWITAAIGFLVRFRDGRRDLSMALLIAAPVPLVAAQAYGGEMVLRLFLFTLPFMAILAAGTVYGRPQAVPSKLKTCGVVAVCVAITMGFLTVRYGNERMDIMTTAELQGVQEMYTIAPPGSLLVSPSGNLPWRAQAFETYVYLPLSDVILTQKPQDLASTMRAANKPNSYIILTASIEAEAELFAGIPSSGFDDFVDQMRASPDFRLVFENSDTKLFELMPAAARTPAVSVGYAAAVGPAVSTIPEYRPEDAA
jgi:hypothetical protein